MLPAPRHSPPPSSPQKVHGTLPAAPPQSKSTHPAPKLAVPTPPPLMVVDVHALSPDPDSQPGPGPGEDRDGDSEAIIRQLEKSLPPWEGFGDLGWMSEVTQVCPFFFRFNVMAYYAYRSADATSCWRSRVTRTSCTSCPLILYVVLSHPPQRKSFGCCTRSCPRGTHITPVVLPGMAIPPPSPPLIPLLSQSPLSLKSIEVCVRAPSSLCCPHPFILGPCPINVLQKF